jgi:5'-nucleotidase / UDP-sugar diphosphatase
MPPLRREITRQATTRRGLLRRASAGGLSLTAIGALPSVRGASGADDPLTVIHGTQFHGRFGRPAGPNMARYATVIDRLREEHSNSAVIATGDDIGKAPLAAALQGRHIVEAMNALDPLVNVIGNHEFDFGLEPLERRIDDSSFPWLSANLRTGSDETVPGSERWTVQSVGDLDVGVFGLTVRDRGVYKAYPEDYRIDPPVETARDATEALREEGVDYVVCASHLSLVGSKAVARSVEGIDLILGDHAEHVFDSPLEIDGTVVNTVGAQFGLVGRVTVTDGLESAAYTQVTPATTPDSEMERIVAKWRRRFRVEDPETGEVIVRIPP